MPDPAGLNDRQVAPIGGSARGYQGIFVSLAARQSRLEPDAQ